jgi:rSAM/selenodomain-associated transferase 2
LGQLSIIIPTLNAAQHIAGTLEAVDRSPLVLERLVVDGGSQDDTSAIAAAAGARVINSAKGRGSQLSGGADEAKGDWLLFLHADTVLEPGWAEEVSWFVETAGSAGAAAFRFALDDRSAASARLERMVAWRCRAWALPYGDQGLLISREFYDALGGYKNIPLFEDVDIVRRIGRGRLTFLAARAVTSAARYKRGGYIRRPLRNIFCLTLYRLGIAPHLIARLYG